MKRIYLDHSATTPVDPKVIVAMLSYFSDKFGNASSVHFFGQEARVAIDNAREKIANFLGCKTTEIIFTSGGSEANNLAVRGFIEALTPYEITNLAKLRNYESFKPHIITSAFEHHAVLEVVKELENEGKIEATYISPNKEGLISVDDVEKAIRSNTVLVSIMYVNNEIGTVQPIRLIGQMIEKVNGKRLIENRNLYGKMKVESGKNSNSQFPISKQISNFQQPISRVYFHTDAVQAAEYFKMNVDFLHVDLLTMSAHKIYGPKGIGLLYVRKGTPITHQIVGGGQEYKMRAGTENVAGIVGFGKAVDIIQKSEIRNPKFETNSKSQIQKLQTKLIDGILKNIPNSFLNGSREFRSPSNVNISFINAEGESILLNLDMEGIAASTGSACTSGSLSPSHVLLSMGLKPEQCHGSIRFTLGKNTTETEIDRV
ncbi:MAG: Uncharacterized protein Athens101428_612, partial [Candidatus Berkelbacteria bacterium Athens1014_28]